MKKCTLFFVTVFCILQSYAQVICVFEGQLFKAPPQALCTYQFPSDTTDDLVAYTYISIANDSLYYADVLTYKNECNSLCIIKAAIKDLKNDVFYNMSEIDLNEKKKTKGFLLTVSTSIQHNVFNTYLANAKYGTTVMVGNMLNIICLTRHDAETVRHEIEKWVNAQ